MAKYDLCVFDMDGTVLNTINDITNGVNAIMERYSFETFTVAKIRSLVGYGLRNLMIDCIPDGEANPEFENAYNDFLAYYAEHSNDETCLYDGVYDLIVKLRGEGYKIAILSNKRHARLVELCDIFLKGLIDLPMGERTDEGIPLKPSPDSTFNLLREMDVPVERAVYIGDAETDFKTAKNAGMDFIGVSWGFRDRSQLEALGAKTIADTMDELYSAITI